MSANSPPEPIPTPFSTDSSVASSVSSGLQGGHSAPTFGTFKKPLEQRPSSPVFERLPLPPSRATTDAGKAVSALGNSLLSKKPLSPVVSPAKIPVQKPPQSGAQAIGNRITSWDDFELLKLSSPMEIPDASARDHHDSKKDVYSASTSMSDTSLMSPQPSQSQHQTLPRMSRENKPPTLARRSHSTRAFKSPARVLVKRKSSGQDNASASVSPVTSEGYSSLGQSPAASFLTSMTDAFQARASRTFSFLFTPIAMELPGIYHPGDSIGDYVLCREIGSGSFSRVFETRSSDMQEGPLAIKIIHIDPCMNFDKQALRRESYLWSKLSHPNLLRMYESFETDDATFVIMELAPGGHLLDHVLRTGRPGLAEATARNLFKQVASAVYYLHIEMGIVHRDIKLENLLLDEQKEIVKLADFGLSEPISESFWDSYTDLIDEFGAPVEATSSGLGHHRSLSTQTTTPQYASPMTMTSRPNLFSTSHAEAPTFAQGSLHYCAPEVLKTPHPPKLCSDIWSLGCVLHAMLTGSLPFNDSYLPRLQMSIINGRWDSSRLSSSGISRSGCDLVCGMLKVKTDDRFRISDIVMHPWLAE